MGNSVFLKINYPEQKRCITFNENNVTRDILIGKFLIEN